MHWPAARCGGNCHCLIRHDVGAVGSQPETRPRDRAVHSLMVEHLVSVSQFILGIDTAGQDDQRHPVLFRVGHHVHTVQRAGANSSHEDHRRAVHMMYTFAHEPSGIFVFGQNKPNARLLQGIDQRQNLTPRHAKSIAASGIIQAARQFIRRAGRGVCHASSPCLPCRGLVLRAEHADPHCRRNRCHGSVTTGGWRLPRTPQVLIGSRPTC